MLLRLVLSKIFSAHILRVKMVTLCTSAKESIAWEIGTVNAGIMSSLNFIQFLFQDGQAFLFLRFLQRKPLEIKS